MHFAFIRSVLLLGTAVFGLSHASGATAGRLFFEAPAPGRDEGRVYYYVPPALEGKKNVPLLIFLHGGDKTSPVDAPARYLGENGWLQPEFASAPFVVAAASAPPTRHSSRWNAAGTEHAIDALIVAAKRHFDVDPDRVFLGGHSMGGFGAYHLGQVMADRFAGVWMSAGAWWEADFRTLYGTPVYLQHGRNDCADAFKMALPEPRRHHWCGVSFARAAHELMRRDGVEHVYDEHAEGHSLAWPAARAATRRFFAWAARQRRNPYPAKAVLETPCGTRHPDFTFVTRARWLEIIREEVGEFLVGAILLEGPAIARTDAELMQQTYTLRRVWREGARLSAENLGGNRFRVTAENVNEFAILLAPAMGDLARPFSVTVNGRVPQTLSAEPLAGDPDYAARLRVIVKP